jgi:lipoate-protein ligase A
MEASSAYKVPGGKLVKIRLTYGPTIENIRILGDFFIHPESAIQKLEAKLTGLKSNLSEDELAAVLEEARRSEGAEMIGVDPKSIAHAIKMAIKNGGEMENH